MLRSVHFDFDKATLKADATPILDEAVQVLKQEGSIDIVIEGHTDSVGTEAYNLGLSRRRAETMRHYLVAHGVAPSRITAEGMGESKPVASNDTAVGRAQNPPCGVACQIAQRGVWREVVTATRSHDGARTFGLGASLSYATSHGQMSSVAGRHQLRSDGRRDHENDHCRIRLEDGGVKAAVPSQRAVI